MGRQRRSINKKPLNPSRKQGRKTERSGLGFFNSNPEPLLSLQRRVEQFDYCELSTGQMNRSFLVVLGDPVDLVFTRREVIGIVGSVRTVERVILCIEKKVSTIAILIYQVGNRCKQAHLFSC